MKVQIKIMLAFLLTGVSCEKAVDPSKVPQAGKYVQVYIPQANYSPSSQSLYMVDTDQAIQYSAYCGGLTAPGGNVTVSFHIDPLLVDSFNLANGTSYPVMPDGSYTMEDTSATIAAGRTSTPPLHIAIKTNGAIKVSTAYLLPVSISQVSSGFVVNNNLRTVFFLIRASYPPGDPRNVDWSDFNLLFAYNGSLVGRKSNGQLWEVPLDNGGNFGDPLKISDDWTAYNDTYAFTGGIVARDAASGNLLLYPVGGDWSLGTPKTIGFGWNIFDVVFYYKGAFITRTASNGALTRFVVDADGNFGANGGIGSGWNIFDKVFPYGNELLARQPDGALLYYALDANGAFGANGEAGSGFAIFDMMIPYGNTLICRKPNGELWSYPLDSNNSFGTPIKIGG